jgi:hypothetical protein
MRRRIPSAQTSRAAARISSVAGAVSTQQWAQPPQTFARQPGRDVCHGAAVRQLEPRIDLGPGDHHEAPLDGAWMGQREHGVLTGRGTVGEDIHVESARPPADVPGAALALLGEVRRIEHLPRGRVGVDDDHGVVVLGLLGAAHRVRLVDVRDRRHVTQAGQHVDGVLERGQPVPEIGPQGECHTGHRVTRTTTSSNRAGTGA